MAAMHAQGHGVPKDHKQAKAIMEMAGRLREEATKSVNLIDESTSNDNNNTGGGGSGSCGKNACAGGCKGGGD